MRPEDVPDDVLRTFLEIYHAPPLRGAINRAREALAAVAPMIEAEERDACAEVAERAYAITDGPMPGRIADAIRARSPRHRRQRDDH